MNSNREAGFRPGKKPDEQGTIWGVENLNNVISNGQAISSEVIDDALMMNQITEKESNELYKKLTKRLESEKRTLEERLHIDHLTGLYNRRALDEKLPALIKQLDHKNGKLEYAPHSIMLIALDIDRFKFINDQYGHPKGDEALILVAEHLREVIREWGGQIVFRPGGDEFIMVSAIKESLTDSEAREIFEKIREQVNSGLSIPIPGDEIAIMLSMGHVLYKKDSTGKIDEKKVAKELIMAADAELSAYKKAHGIERGK